MRKPAIQKQCVRDLGTHLRPLRVKVLLYLTETREIVSLRCLENKSRIRKTIEFFFLKRRTGPGELGTAPAGKNFVREKFVEIL